MEILEENVAQWRMFCRNVCSYRRQRGLTEGEMATLLRIDCRSLQLIEQQELQEDLPVEVVLRAARLFGVKPSELFLRLL